MTEFIKIAGTMIPYVAQPHTKLCHHLSSDGFWIIETPGTIT